MKHCRFSAVMALALAAALLLGACGAHQDIPEISMNPPSQDSQPTQAPTQPKFSVESIRTQMFSDVEQFSLYYDLACYMRYYDLMDAPEGAFSFYAPITLAEAAAAFRLARRELELALEG